MAIHQEYASQWISSKCSYTHKQMLDATIGLLRSLMFVLVRNRTVQLQGHPRTLISV